MWAVSQEGKRAAIPGPGVLVAFIKTGCCQTSYVVNWNRKQLTFVQIFQGEAGCVDKKSSKEIFISNEVILQSLKENL